MMQIGDVVQFTEDHKWCGCFGYINEIKRCGDGNIRYMVGVPMPQGGTAYIFTKDMDDDIEYVGKAVLMPTGDDI